MTTTPSPRCVGSGRALLRRVGLEDGSGGCSLHPKREGPKSSPRSPGKQGGVSLTARLRGTEHYARCPRRDPSTQHRQRRGRAHLVYEDELLWVHLLRDHITLQATLRDSSRSTAPTRSGFLTRSKTLQQSSEGGSAQRLARCAPQEAAPLENRGGRTLLYVFFGQPPNCFIRLEWSSTTLFRRERSPRLVSLTCSA
jgi:hypothetical protein